MLLPIYYFFKGLKPMDIDSKINTKIVWLLRNCDLKDRKVVNKIWEDDLIRLYLQEVIHTGNTYYEPHQQELYKAFQHAEGNFEP